MKVDVKERHEADEVDRIRCLLDMAEVRAECRFALITFGEDNMILTTSNREVSDYERTLLACFAQAAMSREAALHAGILRGIQMAARERYGDDREEWPNDLRLLFETHLRKMSEATLNAADLTRIAMAPFGLKPYADREATIWATDNGSGNGDEEAKP